MGISASYRTIYLAAVLLVASAFGDEVLISAEEEFQTLRVSVQTPNPCWTIKINGVYSTDDELLVVSKLAPPATEEICIQMVGQVEDEISLTAPPCRITHLILGRTWDERRDSSGWGPEADYVYLKSDAELSRMLKSARPMPEADRNATDDRAEVERQTTLSP